MTKVESSTHSRLSPYSNVSTGTSVFDRLSMSTANANVNKNKNRSKRRSSKNDERDKKSRSVFDRLGGNAPRLTQDLKDMNTITKTFRNTFTPDNNDNNNRLREKEGKRNINELQNSGLQAEEMTIIPSVSVVKVQNLHYEVTEKDLQELVDKFVCEMQNGQRMVDSSSVKMKFDRAGRSTGEAEVVVRNVDVANSLLRSLDGLIILGQQVEARIKEGNVRRIIKRSKADGDWKSDLQSL